MGIEPTGPGSHRGPTGFEDQARHQTRSASEPADYSKSSPVGRIGPIGPIRLIRPLPVSYGDYVISI